MKPGDECNLNTKGKRFLLMKCPPNEQKYFALVDPQDDDWEKDAIAQAQHFQPEATHITAAWSKPKGDTPLEWFDLQSG